MASLPPAAADVPLVALRTDANWIDRGLGLAIGLGVALVWWLIVDAAGEQLGFSSGGVLGRFGLLAVASAVVGSVWLRGRGWILFGGWLGHMTYLALLSLPAQAEQTSAFSALLMAIICLVPMAIGLMVGMLVTYLVRLATEE